MEGGEREDPGSEVAGLRRIVVGVEGPASAAALDWAIEEAYRRDATVEAVMVWNDPYASKNWTAPMSASATPRAMPARRSAQLTAFVDDAARRYPGARIEAYLRDGRPVPALVRAAEGADLLVIGTPTDTGLGSVLARSVARQVISQASCPVVTVPSYPHGPVLPAADEPVLNS